MSSNFSAPAYARLREQICADVVSGVWRLGQHITLAELSKHYGVSANPVREALHQLQGEGIVDMRLNRGAVVRQVDASYVRNMYDVRGVIEGMLAAEASLRATDDDITQIRSRAVAYERAVADGEIVGIVRGNREFHRTINILAANPVALEIIDGRSNLVDALRRSLGNRSGRLDEIVVEHRAIVEAIAERDAEKARQRASAHTLRARDHMLENIKEAAAEKSA